MKKILIFLLGISLFLVGCQGDFLDVQPTDQISKTTLDEYANSSPDAVVALTEPIVNGFYQTMIDYQGNHDVFGQKAVDLAMDLQGMDMVQTIFHWFGYDYQMENRDYNYRRVNRTWEFYYQLIFGANEVLQLMPESPDDPKLISFKGQALGIRAYAYFYLIRIYQFTYDGHQQRLGVPLYRLTGSEIEDGRRATVEQVYEGIIDDFEKAYELLTQVNLSNSQFNKNAAALYLSDAYLTMKNYERAAFYANKAREGFSLMSKAQYTDGFNSVDNPEVIWGCPITPENTNYYASYLSHIAHFLVNGDVAQGYGGPYAPKAIYGVLYNQIPASDIRKMMWVSSGPEQYVNRKFLWYEDFLGDYQYARVAEAYLIEAEALAHTNEGQARQVLYDLVKERDSQYQLSTNSGQALLDEIQFQKRIELWGEGRAQFDRKRLKLGVDRTGNEPDNNHTPAGRLKFEWNNKVFVFAMPMLEIDANPNLVLDDNQ